MLAPANPEDKRRRQLFLNEANLERKRVVSIFNPVFIDVRPRLFFIKNQSEVTPYAGRFEHGQANKSQSNLLFDHYYNKASLDQQPKTGKDIVYGENRFV